MTIKIETDQNGHTQITLTDQARFGGGRTRGRGLAANDVFVQSATGHVFVKSSASRDGLARPSEVEIEMIEYFFRETDGPHAPDLFVGDTPPDG